MSDGPVTITGRILEVQSAPEGRVATVSVLGATMRVALDLVPEARVGDEVLLHAGVAVAVVREDGEGAESMEKVG